LKLTAWYPGTVKPVRKGVYIASVGKNKFFRYWNGRWWSVGTFFPYLTGWPNSESPKYGDKQDQAHIKWRGLTEKASIGAAIGGEA